MTEESKKELDKIVVFLNKIPKINLEIASHADERGSDEYNDPLTQKRAQSVVEYLVNKGIERTRLVAKGYGKTKPLFENAETEEQHRINRRTTFTFY